MSEEKFGSGDTLQVVLTGLKNGQEGRQTQVVNYLGNLKSFMDTYGEQHDEAPDIDVEELKKLAKVSAADFKLKMAQLTESIASSGAKPLVQQIVDAVCAYLVAEHQFVISDKDPGSSVFYISKGNLKPTVVDIPNDGKAWMVFAAAPFG